MIDRTPRIGVKVKLFDLMILMFNMYRGLETKSVGFEDANNTIGTLTYGLGGKIQVELDDVESALWSCNLLDEKDKFWHPHKLSFDDFVQGIMGPGFKFNKKYNWIELKD